MEKLGHYNSAMYYHFYHDVTVVGKGRVRLVADGETLYETEIEEPDGRLAFTWRVNHENYHDTIAAGARVVFEGGRFGKTVTVVYDKEGGQRAETSEYTFVDH